MMVTMEIALVICLVAAVAALTWLVARRNPVPALPVAAPSVSADVISQAAMLAVEQAITIEKTGHFLMMDAADRFNPVLLEQLDAIANPS